MAVLPSVIKVFAMNHKNQKSGGGLKKNTEKYSACSRLKRVNQRTVVKLTEEKLTI